MAQTNNQLRLNKFLAERLGVSRREADELIESKKILIDGQPAKLGAKVDKSNKVCYNNKIVPFETEFSYLAFHKPVGFLCSRRSQGAPTIYELLPKKFSHLKSVGRLDKDSSGLILLTNDGDFAFSMTHPKFRKTKVYEVTLNKPLEPLHQQMITDYGIKIGDGLSRFKVIRVEPGTPLSREFRSAAARGLAPAESDPRKMVFQAQYLVFLTEGRNRQIRRTFAALGYTVTKLHRTQFGKYELGNLKPGEYVIIKP
ncbi:rRNA pseudouridine synthase [Candidatus Saccharibacteria bacterium]|nr:rRNA pseudouridine synthase [Candidatus Saccharibacteria bacterium]